MDRKSDGKKRLRRLFAAFGACISSGKKHTADKRITERVIARPEWKKAASICMYMSRHDEVDTKPLLAAAISQGKQVVFPRIQQGGLVLHRIRSIKDFTEGSYRILEPKQTTPVVDPSSVDLYIVPGIAFDRDCYRLGRGKGYYDMLLKSFLVPKLGLSYAFQLLAELPHTSYDVPMTAVITENEIVG